MNQCLRCNRPCSASAMLCDQCRAQLQQSGQRGEADGVDAPSDVEFVPTEKLKAVNQKGEDARFMQRDLFLPSADKVKDAQPQAFHATVPMETLNPDAEDLFQESFDEQDAQDAVKYAVKYADSSIQSLQLLNDAARMMAEADESETAQNGGRGPRASRLAPLRDISADIRRDSTPLPNTAFSTEFGTRDVLKEEEPLPDLWPWLHMVEIDEDKDDWVDRTDPLLARTLPTGSKLQRLLTGRGLRRIFQEARHSSRHRWRLIFIGVCLLTIVALVTDAAVATFAGHADLPFASGLPPTITLSTRIADQGEQVTLHLKDFSPMAGVVLSHDIQEPLSMLNEKGIVHVDAQGSKDVVVVIDNNLESGSHTITAEDMTTRYTASAMLMIGNDPSRPAHLQLETLNVDFGASLEGANSLKTLTLSNGGGGIISWAASSSDAWLMLTPNHGMFSDHQTIQIAVDRNKLKAGDYDGKITFSSNVSAPQDVAVHMKVLPLPANVGAVLSVSPALISFTAIDGMGDPASQSLTISNPGKKPLNWAIKGQSPLAQTNTGAYTYNLVNMASQWLKPDVTSGQVAPGGMGSVKINVHSFNLLPGTYNQVLTFTAGNGALNSPQTVGVSLTVQPRCGLALNTGSLLFTAVAGQTSSSSQVINLFGNASCSSGASWQATSSVHWLTMAPSSGSLQDAATGSITATVNAAGLQPGTYNGTITITLGQNTQTVLAQLLVQAPPSPSAPILGASPLNLNFSMTKGQPNPPAQSITIANTGHSGLTWTVVPKPLSSWLTVIQSKSVLAAGDTGNVLVNVDASGLTPGIYSGQIALSGVDSNGNPAGGSPQTVGVTFTVYAPCTLVSPSATSLVFNTTQGAPDPVAQQFTFSASGNCSWPLTVNLAHSSSANWLKYTGSDNATNSYTLTTSGQSVSIMVSPSNAGLAGGSYHDVINISATDNTGQSVPGSPQSLGIDMGVQQPCTLQATSAGLNFSVTQGQGTGGQSIPLSLSGTCILPVGWTATADSSWIQIASPSGSDNGQGSTLGVSVDASGLGIGTYNGIITISPAGNNGAPVDGKPQIPVILTVTGATVNVTINSCAVVDCTVPVVLPGAQVSLYDGSGNLIASKTADANGVAVFNNIPIGTYKITANGTDVGQVSYSGDGSISVTGTVVTTSINVFAGSSATPTP
ncbi:hypothetical protein KDW_13810 [Dictyobacter vulcani]|uniref:BACON domain-containing protein n=1 Tax=Dictyobacter vulcani TaxID=2607529 RepID=A0A5J4KM11_9CHLR|nr:SpaA isopeptide-forming pilin-related protein [Dictyobacter vulcani]GER87219.1 hypothetical protein KDW_13810 [Dictyobacter vulcani]